MKLILSLLLTLATTYSTFAQEVASPSGNIQVKLHLDDGKPTYNVIFNGKTIIADSHLGLKLDKAPDFISNFNIKDVKYSQFSEKWQPVWGEESEIDNTYNEMFVSLYQKDNKRSLNLRFRVYDDGVGFRYEFPEQDSLS